MLHAFKIHDGKVVVASSVELGAKDIGCFGWEVGEVGWCRDICGGEMGGQCCYYQNGMVRWMCGMKLQDRIPSIWLTERLGLDHIISVLQRNRLQQ